MNSSGDSNTSLRVLALVGSRSDASALLLVLKQEGFDVEAFVSCRELLVELSRGAGTLFLVEEALNGGSFREVSNALVQQPRWSDIPLLLLTQPGQSAKAIKVLGLSETVMNATIIERPVRRATLVSALRVASRARARQYEIREYLDDRVALLERERLLRAEAERINTSKDEFLATLSHELRTPLNAIVGWSHVLRMNGQSSPDVQKGAEVIERNAKVQAQLIEDLLDMSRIMSGKIKLETQIVDLKTVVSAAIASVWHAAELKHVKIREVSDSQSAFVHGDSLRLQQCFWNLFSNAIKFTPKDGSVEAKLVVGEHDVEFTVTDSGQGIAPEFLPFVFERFRQADSSTTRRQGGLGLGLSIVKSLVELHGGCIAAASPGPGQGASFTVKLRRAFPIELRPAPRDRVRSEPQKAQQRPAASLEGLTVLAVDDEADTRMLLKRVLEDSGARVFVAASAKEGFDILQAERPNILLSDIGMPNEDGYAFIRKIRCLRPENGGRIPAAALSAFAYPEDCARALRSGYQMHISKPVLPVELTEVVAKLAARA